MSIKHAPWNTPPPPVSHGKWDQDAWDRFAERYRPEGYKGDIHDYNAYNRWAAEEAVEEAEKHAQHVIEGGAFYVPSHTRADIERHVAVARQCGCGDCFCCHVQSVVRERRDK